MAKTISRNKIWSTHPELAEIVNIIQDVKYNPANYPFKEGETIISPEGKKITLSKDQAEDMNNEEYAAYLSESDSFEVESRSLDEIEISALLKPAGDQAGALETITQAIRSFIEDQGISKIILLNDWPIPYIVPEYTEAKKSNAIFSKWASADYTGGFEVKKDDLSDFLQASLHIVRKVKDYPDMLWHFPKTKYLFSFCEYGVLHVEGYDDSAALFINHLKKSGFVEVNSCEKNSIYL